MSVSYTHLDVYKRQALAPVIMFTYRIARHQIPTQSSLEQGQERAQSRVKVEATSRLSLIHISLYL